MEEKIEDDYLLSIKRENEKALEITDKNSLVVSSNPVIKEEKSDTVDLLYCKKNAKNDILTQKTDKVIHKKVELPSFKQDAETADVSQKADSEIKVKAGNMVLKRKLTEDGAAIERVLSEGEASSGFETVSSIDSTLSVKDFDLTSDSEQDCNAFKKIKNDFADKYKNSNGKAFFWKNGGIIHDRRYRPSGHSINKYGYQRDNRFKKYRQSEHFESYPMYHERDRWSRKKEFYKSKQEISHPKWKKYSDHHKRSWSRCSDQSIKSRESKCSDQSWKLRGNESIYTNRSGHYRSSEHYYKSRGSKSPIYKIRKIESRRSRSPEKSKLNFSRYLPSRKRKNCFSNSPPASKWKRLDNYATTNRIKRDHMDGSLRRSFSSEREERHREIKTKERRERKRRKERTPFLVELERKLKEAEVQRNATKEPNLPSEQIKTPLSINVATTTEPVKWPSPSSNLSSNYLLHPQNALGTYPLQCTQTSSVSMDTLPIISGQEASPMHITERHVLDDMNVTQCNVVSLCRQRVSLMPQTEKAADKDIFQNKATEIHHLNPSTPQPPAVESNLLGLIHSFNAKTSKSDLLIKYQKRARERNEDVLKCKEIGKNLGINPSKGEIKRSVPRKIWQKRTSKDEYHREIITILDSNDSDCASGSKSLPGSNKECSRLADKVGTTSDGVEDILKLNCGNENSKASSVESSSEEFIVKKVRKALQSLKENNFNPPALGRFIISKILTYPAKETSPNISPLLRNRIKLPFLTPNSEKNHVKEKLMNARKATNTFKFLSEETSTENGEKPVRFNKALNKNFTATKFPVFTFDFAMQCDFTTVIIQNLTSKLAEMEMEILRLQNTNADLLESYRNLNEAKEKKEEELAEALLEIEKGNNEIVSLKNIISEKSAKET